MYLLPTYSDLISKSQEATVKDLIKSFLISQMYVFSLYFKYIERTKVIHE